MSSLSSASCPHDVLCILYAKRKLASHNLTRSLKFNDPNTRSALDSNFELSSFINFSTMYLNSLSAQKSRDRNMSINICTRTKITFYTYVLDLALNMTAPKPYMLQYIRATKALCCVVAVPSYGWKLLRGRCVNPARCLYLHFFVVNAQWPQ